MLAGASRAVCCSASDAVGSIHHQGLPGSVPRWFVRIRRAKGIHARNSTATPLCTTISDKYATVVAVGTGSAGATIVSQDQSSGGNSGLISIIGPATGYA